MGAIVGPGVGEAKGTVTSVLVISSPTGLGDGRVEGGRDSKAK